MHWNGVVAESNQRGIIFVAGTTMLPNERPGLIGTTLPRWVRLTTFLRRVPAGINWKGHGALALSENKCMLQGRKLGMWANTALTCRPAQRKPQSFKGHWA